MNDNINNYHYKQNFNNNNEINKNINNEKKQYSLCKIYNYGFNCYMNSGLQIISRCDKFREWLKNSYYPKEECPFIDIIKNIIEKILYSYLCDPKVFIRYFTSRNKDFPPYSQNCSQYFIKTVLSNINEEILIYSEKHNLNKDLKIFKYEPNIYEIQSLPYSYFSGILKTESTGNCNNCGEVKNYSFMDFFDQHMFLDTIKDSSTDFKNVLKENLGYPINVKSSCPYCKRKIIFKDISKIIKLPEILVFTIERYIGGTNEIAIKPNEKIDVKDYVEEPNNFKNTTYELFAINIRFGYSNQFGHQICQIKKDNNWCILDDTSDPIIREKIMYNNNIYGLFYKKIEQ